MSKSCKYLFFFSLGWFLPPIEFFRSNGLSCICTKSINRKISVRFDCQRFKFPHWTSQYRSSIHLNDFSKKCIIIWRDWQKTESSLNDNLILNIKSINEIALDWIACEWNTDTLPHSHMPQRSKRRKKTLNNIWQIYDGAHLTLSDRNGIHLSSFIHTMTTTSAKLFEHQFLSVLC